MQATQTILFLFIFLVLVCFCEAGKMMCGGVGEAKIADAESQEIAEELKDEAQKKCNTPFETFKVIGYKTQVVAGMNYFMKVEVGNDNYIHIKVYKPLPHTGEKPSLTGCQGDKKKEDAIDFF